MHKLLSYVYLVRNLLTKVIDEKSVCAKKKIAQYFGYDSSYIHLYR